MKIKNLKSIESFIETHTETSEFFTCENDAIDTFKRTLDYMIMAENDMEFNHKELFILNAVNTESVYGISNVASAVKYHLNKLQDLF